MILNDVEYFYVRNGQGDIIALLDSTGVEVASYTYDSWGKLVSIKDENGNDVTGDNTKVGQINPYRYRGYRYDTETGLYYLQSRYYNPEWGRFVNADVIAGILGDILSHNRFAYCGNNPVNYLDLNGLWRGSTKIHRAVQNHVKKVILSHLNIELELTIKGAGRGKGAYGFADIANLDTGEIWEVKPDKKYHYRAGDRQLSRYVKHSDGGSRGGRISDFNFIYENQIIYVRNHPTIKGLILYRVVEANKSHSTSSSLNIIPLPAFNKDYNFKSFSPSYSAPSTIFIIYPIKLIKDYIQELNNSINNLGA